MEILEELPDVIDTEIGRGSIEYTTHDDILIKSKGNAFVRNVYTESGDIARCFLVVDLFQNDDGSYADMCDLLEKKED